MHLEPPQHDIFCALEPAFDLRATPRERRAGHFFLKTPSALFYCRDAPPRRLLDTHSWHSARGRCMTAFDTRCRCFSTHLLERGSAVQLGRRRRRVGSRRDCVWTFLNFAPSAEGGVHGSGLKKSRKNRKCNGYPEKKSPAAPRFFFGWQQNAACRTAPLRVRLRKCSAISLVPAKQRVSPVGRSDWEPCPVEKKLDLRRPHTEGALENELRPCPKRRNR